MSIFNKTILVACISVSAVSYASAASAWLPQAGASSVTLSYSQESYDMFWLGKDDKATSADSQQVSYGLSGGYGLTNDIALDMFIGYARNEFGHPGGAFLTDSGVTDINIGMTYQLIDEQNYEGAMPTIAVRCGIIIAGSYDTYPEIAAPQSAASIGDGGSGFELQILAAKYYADVHIGYAVELGYRNRSDDIPNDIFYSLGVFYSFQDRITCGIDYVVNDSQGDLDISTPGFAGRFPQLEEDSEELFFSLSYAFEETYSAGITYGQTLSGRNTPQDDIMSVWVSTDF